MTISKLIYNAEAQAACENARISVSNTRLLALAKDGDPKSIEWHAFMTEDYMLEFLRKRKEAGDRKSFPILAFNPQAPDQNIEMMFAKLASREKKQGYYFNEALNYNAA